MNYDFGFTLRVSWVEEGQMILRAVAETIAGESGRWVADWESDG